jgi:AsmA protein
VLAAGVLATVALLVLFPPAGILKDRLAKIASDATGRTVTLGGAHLVVFPNLKLRLDSVTLSNPPGMAGPDLLRAEQAEATVRLLALFKRKFELLSLSLKKPVLNLQEDAAGNRNWPVTVNQASGSKSASVLPAMLAVDDGEVSFTSAKTGTSRRVDGVTGVLTTDPVSGAGTGKGRFAANGEIVTFDVAIADLRAGTAGTPMAIKATLEAPRGKAEFDGQAEFSGRGAVAGMVTASTPSAVELARWLGANVSTDGEPFKTTVSGKVKASGSEVVFDGTNIIVNGAMSRIDGRLALDGPRPKLEGNVSSDRIDLARLFGAGRPQRAAPQALAAAAGGDEIDVAPGWNSLLDGLKELETGGTAQRAAAEADPLAAAAKKPAWSNQPFNLKALRIIDLDVTFTAAELAYGGLDLKNGRMKAALTDGALEAKVESLAVGKGKAQGMITLDSRADPPRAAVTLAMTDVAAEPIVTEITGRPLISGTSNVDITAKATGQTQSQLTSTLEGKAKFLMGKGAVRGFDVRRMISEWWRQWSFDLGMKTGFERLEAQYDIRKGIMKRSPGLALGGNEVEINSKGDVNVAAKRINQEIRIKVIPPPTALPVPVKISGDWAKPSIGVDWGSLFSSAGGIGGPQGVAPSAQPTPPEVQAAIRRVLAADLPASELSDDGKAMLRSLLPPEVTQ